MKHIIDKNIFSLLLFLIPSILIGCGSTGGGNSDNNGKDAYSVGGTITGLKESVVLQNNGTDNLEISADGLFVFAHPINNGTAYDVTFQTPPSAQVCAIHNSTGIISHAPVETVFVTCSDLPPDTYTVGGTVSGLTGTVVLQNNGGDNLEIDADGPYEFNSPIVNGTDYEVTVLSQPEGQSCTIENATGTVSGENVVDVIVTCSPTVTFLFTAEIIYIDDYSNVLGGNLYVGQEISGQYTYGLDAVDSNAASYVGDYWYFSNPFGIEVDAGDLYFKTDPDTVNFLFELVNDYPGYYIKDNYLLRSYTNITNLDGFVDHIAWQLDDPTGTALDSTELAAFPPVLEDWTSPFGLTIEGCYTPEIDGFCDIDTFFVRAIVTSVTVE